MSDASNNFPYESPDDFDDSERGIPNNPSGREFLDTARASIRKTVEKYSVTQNAISIGSERSGSNSPTLPFGSAGVFNHANDVDVSFESSHLGLAVPVDTNKVARLQAYDNIARYPELDWCINEIANDFVHEDIEGNFIKLKFKIDTEKYGDGVDTIIVDEFKHMVSNFDLRANGYNMMRKFIIEGELCFENVIDPNHPEYGVIGAKYIPNVFYDFLRDRTSGQVCGLYIDPEKMKTCMQFGAYGGGSASYGGQSSTMFNAIRQVPMYTYTYSQDMRNKIVLPWEQVTYANSGVMSEDGSIVFPQIEKVVVPVRQLLLMHDAMVILRITRAPDKLCFNLDMTGFQPKEAKNFVRNFVEQRRAKKALQGSGNLTNVYNSETMLDAYYFWKTSEAGGATVTSLNNTARYNEMHDVEYFLRRILKFMGIPWSRYSESQANRQDKNSIQNEEFSFAKMIVRYQQVFSAAIKKTFITHLRLRGLFDKYDMSESDFDIVMNPPLMFETYQAEQRFNDFLTIMSSASSLDFLSKNIILKKVFGWNDSEIKENEVNVRREALFKSQTELMQQKLSADGTPTAGRIWLDPEKYLTQQDPEQAGGMQPPQAPGGEIPNVPNVPPPQPEGGNMEAPPNMNVEETPTMEEPFDDSGLSVAEKNSSMNPDFGEFERNSELVSKDSLDVYPETEEELTNLESGISNSLHDTFEKNFGDDADSYRSLEEIFNSEFAKSEEKYKKDMEDVFREQFEKSKSDKEDENGLTGIFNDMLKSAEDENNISASLDLTDAFRDVFIVNPSKK